MRERWGVLISGNGSTLQSLLDMRDQIDLSLVISSRPSAYGILRARRSGVPVEIIPEGLRGVNHKLEAENWIFENLMKHKVNRVFLAGYMKIVSEKFIDKFRGKILNVHPSLLPRYKGVNAFEEALRAGDHEAGVTVHEVVADVDSGKTVLQGAFDIPSHRQEDLSRLFLHIHEQRFIREALRKRSIG